MREKHKDQPAYLAKGYFANGEFKTTIQLYHEWLRQQVEASPDFTNVESMWLRTSRPKTPRELKCSYRGNHHDIHLFGTWFAKAKQGETPTIYFDMPVLVAERK